MAIFKSYTGNAMLNNASMTIETLADLKRVEDITPAVLLEQYKNVGLKSLNKRLKSYTMLFTKNGPLHNDKKNGEKIYDSLFVNIIASYENEGDKICEISGLKFSKTFEQIYIEALKKVGFSENEIKKKDTTLNRGWFPLIGGLGSDAQALPQAKFTVQIHPICVAILQFLPLSSLLYDGGILLIDSSNFELTRRYVADNQKLLWGKIKATSVTEQIENVRDFNKGNYILKAIELLKVKEDFEETYSDLNMWSFSNSGTGASCSIDRVPNSLIRKLMAMDKNPAIGAELKNILNNVKSSSSFLEELEANNEWWLLYPNVFGSGKKAVDYPGVSVDFLEAYFEVIGNKKKTEYAKYIAGLINEYKTRSFEKYLEKTDAHSEKEYRIDLYAVLVAAAEQGKWSLSHHIQILDDKDLLPVKNIYYQLHKLIHFYYQKNHSGKELPAIPDKPSLVLDACNWLITLIKKDSNQNKIIERLTDKNEYSFVNYTEMFIRLVQSNDVSLDDITITLYSDDFKPSHYGINELLRIFFSQKEQTHTTIEKLSIENGLTNNNWFAKINNFATDYQQYYYEKYKNNETGYFPINKFKKIISNIPLETSKFMQWLREAIENTNEFIEDNARIKDKWSEDDLLYAPNGEMPISFGKLAIKFLLTKQSLITKEQVIQQS